VKSYLHARVHAKSYKGNPGDYIDIDNFIDSSKQAVADVRHRTILHSAFGCFLVEQVFGITRVNSDGKTYSPRDIAEDHIQQDISIIPSVDKYLNNIKLVDMPKIKDISILEHAEIDSKIFGVSEDSILPIHHWMESAFQTMPDNRHNVILHHVFGTTIAEKVFGLYLEENNKKVLVSDIIKNHITREFGYIPTMNDFLQLMKIQDWFSGTAKHHRAKVGFIPLVY
jgi:hypothetical protein